MPVDPDIRALLDTIDALNVLPMSRYSPTEARHIYHTMLLARRGRAATEDVAKVEERTFDGPAGPVSVRVYTPAEEHGRLVTYAHGGGFVIGDLDTHDPQARRLCNSLGAIVVSVDFRLAPEHPWPAGLDDFAAAVAWATTAFPDHVKLVAGESTGGSLAAAAAIRVRDAGGPELAAMLLSYPAVDPAMSMPSITEHAEGCFLLSADLAWFWQLYVPDDAARADPTVDLLNADLTDLPPTVVVTAEFDPVHDEGAEFAKRLAAAGVPVRHLEGPGMVHGFCTMTPISDGARRLRAEALSAVAELLNAPHA